MDDDNLDKQNGPAPPDRRIAPIIEKKIRTNKALARYFFLDAIEKRIEPTT